MRAVLSVEELGSFCCGRLDLSSRKERASIDDFRREEKSNNNTTTIKSFGPQEDSREIVTLHTWHIDLRQRYVQDKLPYVSL